MTTFVLRTIIGYGDQCDVLVALLDWDIPNKVYINLVGLDLIGIVLSVV